MIKPQFWRALILTDGPFFAEREPRSVVLRWMTMENCRGSNCPRSGTATTKSRWAASGLAPLATRCLWPALSTRAGIIADDWGE